MANSPLCSTVLKKLLLFLMLASLLFWHHTKAPSASISDPFKQKKAAQQCLIHASCNPA